MSGKNHGFVLLATLWVMTMLSAIALTMAYQVRVEASVERNALDVSQLRLAARGGVHVATAKLVASRNKEEESADVSEVEIDLEQWQSIAVGDAEVSIFKNLEHAQAIAAEAGAGAAAEPVAINKDADTVAREKSERYGPDDHESRLNINVAEPAQLTGFPGVSTVLAEEIARYRRSLQNESDQTGQAEAAVDAAADDAGSESAVSDNAGSDNAGSDNAGSDSAGSDNAAPGNAEKLIQGPIVSLQDLLAVEGVTGELLFEGSEAQPALAQYLTTTSSGKVNLNTASEAVLLAAGLIDSQVQVAVEQRENSLWTTVEDFLQQADIEPESEKWERLAQVFTTQSSTFHIVARATLTNIKRDYLVQATLFNDGESVRFVQWLEQ